jgi:hypothetical protein
MKGNLMSLFCDALSVEVRWPDWEDSESSPFILKVIIRAPLDHELSKEYYLPRYDVTYLVEAQRHFGGTGQLVSYSRRKCSSYSPLRRTQIQHESSSSLFWNSGSKNFYWQIVKWFQTVNCFSKIVWWVWADFHIHIKQNSEC